jgi:hypothetical protein
MFFKGIKDATFESEERIMKIIFNARLVLSVFSAMFAIGICSAAFAEEMPENLKTGKIHFLSGKYLDAAAELMKIDPKSVFAPEAFYLASRCYKILNKPETVTCFEKVIKEWPSSEYCAQAKYALAEYFLSNEDLKRAAEILNSMRKALLDSSRWAVLAEKCREIGVTEAANARKFSENLKKKTAIPSADKKTLDEMEKALRESVSTAARFLNFAANHEPALLDCESFLLDMIFISGAQVNFDKETEYSKRFVSRFKHSPEYFNILVKLAANLEKKDRAEAQKILYDFAAENQNSTDAPKAIMMLADMNNSSQSEREEYLKIIVEKYPDSAQFQTALISLAELYINSKDNEKASSQLEKLIARYPKEKRTRELFMTFVRNFAQAGRFAEAIDYSSKFLTVYPEGADSAEAAVIVENSRIKLAEAALSQREFPKAVSLFEEFIKTYPASNSRIHAEFCIAEAYRLAENSALAMDAFESLVAKWPESEQAMKSIGLLFQLCQTDQRTMERFMAFAQKIKESDKFSKLSAEIERIIAAMRSPRLSATAPRPYRTDEPVAVSVVTRNLENVSWQVNEVDAKTLFTNEKHVLAAGYLDTQMVPPVSSGILAITSYTPLREIKTELNLGIQKPGLYVVTLTGDRIFSRVTVIVSDLEFVSKTSPDETRVFVLDVRKKVPVPGARVLVATELSYQESGITDDTGMHILAKQIDNQVPKNILVLKDGQIAIGSLDKYENKKTEEPDIRIYVATDRTVYRPGDTVNLWILARKFNGTIYEILDNASVKIRLFLPTNRNELGEIRTDKYGIARTSFKIEKETPPEYFMILVNCDNSHSVNRYIKIEEYVNPAVRVRVERDAAAPAGKTRLILTAEYQSGIPAAGALLEAYIEDVRPRIYYDFQRDTEMPTACGRPTIGWHSWSREEKPTKWVTDENGKVFIDKPTLRDTAGIKFVVRGVLSLSGLESGIKIPFYAESSFKLPSVFACVTSLKSPVAGEPTQVAVAAFDIDGKRIAVNGKFTVKGGPRGDVTYMESDITTSEYNDILVPVTYPIPQYYYLGFNTENSGWNAPSFLVTVPPNAADGALRLTFDKSSYKTGETMKLTIDAPEGERIALLTMESEKLHSWKYIVLKGGKQETAITAESTYQPNVFAALYAVDRTKGFSGNNAMAYVMPILRVTVTPDKEKYRPGEDVTLRITTVDADGKPVSASVALGVVEDALFDRYPDPMPPIREYFNPKMRKHLIATDSSCGFKSDSVNGTINEMYFAELVRREKIAKQGPPLIRPQLGIESYENLADKILNGNSLVDAYGIGGGTAGAYGSRWGRGSFGSNACREGPYLRSAFPDTAYWNPEILTNASGIAVVSFKAPDSLTVWRITAYAADLSLGAGETRRVFRTTEQVALYVNAPEFLRRGDSAMIFARVGNSTDETIKTRISGNLLANGSDLDCPPGMSEAVNMQTARNFGNEAAVETVIEFGENSDGVLTKIPVYPSDFKYVTGFSGVLRGTTTQTFTISENASLAGAELRITFDPSPAAAAAASIRFLGDYPYGCMEQTVSRFLPLLEWMKIRGMSANSGGDYSKTINESLVRLASMQSSGNMWGMWDVNTSSAFLTGYTLLAMRRANAAGFSVSRQSLENGIGAAGAVLNSEELLPGSSDAELAMLLYGSGVRAPKFESLLRISKGTNDAPVNALMALAAFERGDIAAAKEFAAELDGRLFTEAGPSRIYPQSGSGWLSSATSRTALALLAFSKIQGDSDSARKTARGLLGLRIGSAWPTTLDSSLAAIALFEYHKVAATNVPDKPVEIVVNGKPAGAVSFSKDDFAAVTQMVSSALLKKGENSLEFKYSGTGEAPYSAALGISIDARFAAVLPNPFGLESWFGSYIWKEGDRPEGYSIIRQGFLPDKRLKKIAAGSSAIRQIRFAIPKNEQCIVIEDPIVPGLIPDEKSVKITSVPPENFRFEKHKTHMAFFITGATADWATISYECRAVFPGDYTVLPTTAASMYNPQIFSATMPQRIEIRKEKAEVGPTPDATMQAAKKLFDSGDYAKAEKEFAALMSGYVLDCAAISEAASRIMLCQIRTQRFTEALVTFKKNASLIRQGIKSGADEIDVSDLFFRAGEFRSSSEIDNRLIHSQFRDDLSVWESMPNEILFGPDGVRPLLMKYPLDMQNFEAIRNVAPIFGEILGEGREVVNLTSKSGSAIWILEKFALSLEDNAARLGAFTDSVKTRLKTGDYSGGLAAAKMLLEAATGSTGEDEAMYLKAFALFALGRSDEAEKLAWKVRNYTGKDCYGEPAPSIYRGNATHMLAQIMHAKGFLDNAAALYGELKDFVPDAAAVQGLLLAKELQCPAKADSLPGENPILRVESRNIAELKVVVYPVDPILVHCFRGGWTELGALKLSGLAKKAERTVAVKSVSSLKPAVTEIELDKMEEGTAVAIITGGGKAVTVIVNCTKIALTRVVNGTELRFVVTDVKTGMGVKGCLVKVFLGEGKILESYTDSRGIVCFNGVSDVNAHAAAQCGGSFASDR